MRVSSWYCSAASLLSSEVYQFRRNKVKMYKCKINIFFQRQAYFHLQMSGSLFLSCQKESPFSGLQEVIPPWVQHAILVKIHSMNMMPTSMCATVQMQSTWPFLTDFSKSYCLIKVRRQSFLFNHELNICFKLI